MTRRAFYPLRGVTFHHFRAVVCDHFAPVLRDYDMELTHEEETEEAYQLVFSNRVAAVDVVLEWDGYFATYVIRMVKGRIPGVEKFDLAAVEGPLMCTAGSMAAFHGETDQKKEHEHVSSSDDFRSVVHANVMWVEKYCRSMLSGDFRELKPWAQWQNTRNRRA